MPTIFSNWHNLNRYKKKDARKFCTFDFIGDFVSSYDEARHNGRTAHVAFFTYTGPALPYNALLRRLFDVSVCIQTLAQLQAFLSGRTLHVKIEMELC